MEDNIDLYTDYLLSSFGQTSSTGLSRLVDEAISHDRISRFLSGNEFNSRTLWQEVKPLVRKYQTDDACLIFDDIIVAKPHTDENEMVCWHFDHSTNQSSQIKTALQSKEMSIKLDEQFSLELSRSLD